jgi:DNA-3-methyladenine glycosylase I
MPAGAGLQAGEPAMNERRRCGWAGTDPLYVAYHDREWGVPVHRDRKLFEMLVLEGAQAGLSWITILRKRDRYREVFCSFDPRRVAGFDRRTVERLLRDPGIVRNRAKVEAAVRNARVFLEIRKEFGTFDKFCWQFVGGRPKVNRRRSLRNIPARTKESETLSCELYRRGMRFVGPTICYAFMQAVGMVNDHTVGCFRHAELQRMLQKRRT